VREVATTLLDALGLLLVAFGLGAALFPLISWAASAVAGGVVLTGSWLAARQGTGGGGER
jgi:hypothetical protein